MKKPFLLIASIVAAAVVSLFVVEAVSAQKPNELFYQNVEVLASTEIDDIYYEKIWVVYHRSDGGINCTKGGTEQCI